MLLLGWVTNLVMRKIEMLAPPFMLLMVRLLKSLHLHAFLMIRFIQRRMVWF